MVIDTTVELQYEGGRFCLETRVPGGILSYPLGCYTMIRATAGMLGQAKFPEASIMSDTRICENRNRGLVKKSTGFDIGPSVYWMVPGKEWNHTRVLSPIYVPDELPLDQMIEVMQGTEFKPELVWAEVKRIGEVRNALGIECGDAWAKLEGLTAEGEISTEHSNYFRGNA